MHKKEKKMFKNYLKIALRNLLKNKLYTIIKCSGLALALMVNIVIFSWIKHEMSYDKFHHDVGKIYRIIIKGNDDGGSVSISPAFKTKLLDNIPDIQHSVRLFKSSFIGKRTKVAFANKVFTNDDIYYTDDNFFEVFSFPLLRGSPNNVLKQANAVVITAKTAQKYFGETDPIGKTLTIADTKELVVTGVLKNLPGNSHFHFDVLISIKNHPWDVSSIGLGSAWVFPTYIKTHEQTTVESAQNNFTQAIAGLKMSYPEIPEYNLTLQPITDIHLHSHYDRELEANNDIKYIYLFFTIGLLVILIAGINYINLSTAHSIERGKEVGIRKVLGAQRKQFIYQFMGESIIVSFFSFLVAIFVLEIINPVPLFFQGSDFYTGIFSEGYILTFALLMILIMGAFTGFFPAIILGKLNPDTAIKTGFNPNNKQGGVRNFLLVFQFSISIILIVSTIIIYQQMQFIRNKNLGYNKNQTLVLYTGYSDFYKKTGVLKNTLTSHPDILHVSSVSQLPTNIKTAEYIDTKKGGKHGVYFMSIDKNYFKTLDIKIFEGEERIYALNPEQNTNQQTFENKFVVNKTLLDLLEVKLEEAINEKIVIRHGNMKPGQIIGVVDDFHFQSLHNPIQPLVLEFTPWNYEYLLVRTNSGNIPNTIRYIKSRWHEIAGSLPFEYHFLDETYEALYNTEMHTGRIILVFTLVSIFIVVLGLFGLSSFSIIKRTKEIGVRKVLGATVTSLVSRLSKDFVKLVLVANLLAWPIAYYAMNEWLQNFAYRIEMSWWIFLLAGVLALLIALLTVSYQAIKVAIVNPIESLRYE
jgi:putative ABC transport system permease protein